MVIANKLNKDKVKKDLPDIGPGYTVIVHQKIKEGEKERIQKYEGLVIGRKGGTGLSSTITVRKISEGIGVEKIFPLNSPSITKIEVIRKAKVRRAKLNYLRTYKKRLKETKVK
ncbi:MAG: 50S ribosomal protein L19 [bacterium]|nr:50S ribosomal protein L19 [bacterium]